MKTASYRWNTMFAALAAACSLAACSGGGSSSPDMVTSPPATTTPPVAVTPPAGSPPTDVGAPASVGNVMADGRNWFNYRRSQIGIATLAENTFVDRAAQNHSDYQRLNDTISHDETPGLAGFTGADVRARLTAAGLPPSSGSFAYGEVISASSSNSGFYMAEELITAIYHRFVVFEPMFKEIGTGSGTTSRNYTYFTADFVANNGFGAGVGRGNVVNWPYNGQTGVPPNFFSDQESPDPVANANEVGYPVSVHADITAVLAVQSFTIRERGGASLGVKLLQHASDEHTPDSAAAIVPLARLKAGTTYDVTFVGTADNIPVSKSWSFTTK
ncbi:CAP domain-containing protein [Massilia sp. R2A-15]|uniref:CAP domain-containing protein n=1 Tax=Massilia sp. R2A-15 TaxID=3064278 RepID=UPI0027335A73|nr:CAP domain-containing protein [Massilia sp. R2A-15]WLI88788.1 CAP domain-containing protein [Massilia sp. R2A-15]